MKVIIEMFSLEEKKPEENQECLVLVQYKDKVPEIISYSWSKGEFDWSKEVPCTDTWGELYFKDTKILGWAPNAEFVVQSNIRDDYFNAVKGFSKEDLEYFDKVLKPEKDNWNESEEESVKRVNRDIDNYVFSGSIPNIEKSTTTIENLTVKEIMGNYPDIITDNQLESWIQEGKCTFSEAVAFMKSRN